MADQPDVLRFQWGGMNRVLNPFLIKPGDLKLCLNYNSDTFYAKTRRGGYSVFLDNPDSKTVYNLIPFDRGVGYRFVLRNSGTSLYRYGFTGSTWGATVKSNFGGVNDQVQLIGDVGDANAQLDATTKKLAQGIKVSGSGSRPVPSLWILLNQTGTGGNITLQIETDTLGSPSGVIVPNATFTIATGDVPVNVGEGSWVRVDFATAPVLTAGTQYHLTISAVGVNGTNYYTWYGSQFDVYPNGTAKYSTDSGTTYSVIANEPDFGFILNVTQGSRCSSSILVNKLILSNGVDPMCWTSDGFHFTDIDPSPPAPYTVVWQNRVYAGGVVYSSSELYYSAGIDPTSWANNSLDPNSGGSIQIDPDHNGVIVGLDVENDRLIVHKTKGSYKVVPDQFGRPDQVEPIGAATSSNWSIARSEDFNTGFFFGVNGFFQNSGQTPALISSAIQDFVKSVNVSTAQDMSGYFFQYKYFCTMGTSITSAANLGHRIFTNPLMVYDVRLREFYLYTTATQVNTLSSWKHIDGYFRMFTGDTLGNTFVWDDSTSDNGVAIDGELETWEDYLGAPHITKRYEYITLYTNPGCEASALYSLDYQNPIDLGDLSTGATKVYFGDNGFNQKNIALKIKDMSTTIPSVFYGYVLRLTGEEVPVQRRGRAK